MPRGSGRGGVHGGDDGGGRVGCRVAAAGSYEAGGELWFSVREYATVYGKMSNCLLLAFK